VRLKGWGGETRGTDLQKKPRKKKKESTRPGKGGGKGISLRKKGNPIMTSTGECKKKINSAPSCESPKAKKFQGASPGIGGEGQEKPVGVMRGGSVGRKEENG